MRLGLGQRFAAITTGLVVIAILTASSLWIWYTRESHDELADIARTALRQSSESALIRRGETITGFLANTLPNLLYRYDMDGMFLQLDAVLQQQGVLYAIIFDPQGKIVHDGSRDIVSYGHPMRDSLASEVLAANAFHVIRTTDLIDISAPIHLYDKRIGGLRIGLSLDEAKSAIAQTEQNFEDRYQQQRQTRGIIAVATLAVLIMGSLLVALIASRRIVRPIKRLLEGVGQVERGSLDVQLTSSRRDEIGVLTRAFAEMVQTLKRNNRHMQHMAYHDALTGLPNRTLVRDLLERITLEDHERKRRMALLFVDMDDFKRINDTLGHDAGDTLLRQFATRLKTAVEEAGDRQNSEVGRLGGDEFIVMVTDTVSHEHTDTLAKAILSATSQPYQISGKRVYLSSSIGITRYPEDGVTAEFLLKNADIAMYHAKLKGKNQFAHFSYSMTTEADERLALENDLRHAMELQELRLHYQPIHSLDTGNIVGFEALLRWKHPFRGELSPSIFVPVAEETGLIDTLGQWVIDAVCADVAQWQDAMPEHAYVAVNISGKQLRRDTITENILKSIDDAGISRLRIALELTESSLLEDEEKASIALHAARDAGLRVWLDDFGTGFSGLSHLRRVPVDGVKIDRSFVADAPRDPDDVAIIGAIVAMAHSLGMRVTAEGVENEQQRDLLRSRGCDQAQGFLYGVAMHADEVREALKVDARSRKPAKNVG